MSGSWKLAFLLACVATLPAANTNDSLIPLTVCELLHDMPSYEGKPVAALGRYSFRQEGRWLGEANCGDPQLTNAALWLEEDTKDAPKPPNNYAIDGATLNQKFADLRKTSPLAKFRFGTPGYDRWAVVYGRIATRKGDAAKKYAADLIFRGDGAIVFLTP